MKLNAVVLWCLAMAAVCSAAIQVAGVARGQAADGHQQSPAPLRAEVDLLTFDVQVAPRKDAPLRNFTAADFDLRIAGHPRTVVSATFLHLDEGPKARSPFDHRDAGCVFGFRRQEERPTAHYLVAVEPTTADRAGVKNPETKLLDKAFAVHWVGYRTPIAIDSAIGAPALEQTAWGESISGAQLRVAVSDGPLPQQSGLVSLEAQLRNQGADPVTFIGESIIHPGIEVDGVWYAQVWAGSCCSAPRTIQPGGKSEVFSFRVLPAQTFASSGAAVLDLKPGRHTIRIRTVSSDRIQMRIGSRPAVLTSNAVTIDIPAGASNAAIQPAMPPPCGSDASRRAERVHGAVERGDPFRAPMSGGWVLQLQPVEFGWSVQVSTTDRSDENLARLTPPWRFVPNPREIEGWHFRNADNTAPNDGSVNAPGSLREFIFSPLVGRGIEYTGSGTTTADVERVRAYGRGWLSIESYRLSPPRSGERAAIESLTFWACLTWPAKGEMEPRR